MVDVHEHLGSDAFSVLKIRARYTRRLALERRNNGPSTDTIQSCALVAPE